MWLDAFRRRVDTDPQRIAAVSRGESISYRELLDRRLEHYAAGERAAWNRMTEGARNGWWLATQIETSENLLRESLKANHAATARAHLQKDAEDADAGHLARWVEDQVERLVRGTFLQRSTSLFARARGEAEHEVVDRAHAIGLFDPRGLSQPGCFTVRLDDCFRSGEEWRKSRRFH